MADDKSCCGGQHRVMYRKDENGKTVRVEVLEANIVSVPIEFTGHKVGNFSVAGAITKRSYRFGTSMRVQEVAEEDVPSILQQGNFRRVGAAPVIQRPVRRGTAPNTDAPIASPNISAAEAAARVATQVQAPPKDVRADVDPLRGSGRPRSTPPATEQPVRITPRRDTRGTTKVNPRTLGL